VGLQAQDDDNVQVIRVDLVPQEALGIEEPAGGGVRVRWAGGEVRADAVLLALPWWLLLRGIPWVRARGCARAVTPPG
jgi:hypothetical protein